MALSFALLAFGIAAGCRSLRTAASLDTAKSKYVVIDLAALKEGANNPLSALSEVPDGGPFCRKDHKALLHWCF